MNRSQKGFAHFFILVIVLAVVLAGGWFYSRNNTPRPESSYKYYVANIEQCPLIEFDCPEGYRGFGDDKGCGCEMTTQTIDGSETANWGIYRNEKYGFSLKYPPDWIISPHSSTLEKYDPNSPTTLPTHSVGISVYNYPQNARLEDTAINFGTACVGECPETGSGIELTEGIDYQMIPPAIYKRHSENFPEYYYIVTNNGSRSAIIATPESEYYIHIHPGFWPKNENHDLVDQILSTFEFSN